MITLQPQAGLGPLRMPWRNAIAVGRAFDLVRSDLLEHLRYLQREVGYRYCRFHGLFHDDMNVVRRRPEGGLAYQWFHVDQVFDALQGVGLRPFVELNPMPAALASGTQTMFHYKMNVTPPASWEEWGDLVESFARHVIQRYGIDEVRQWYFEVWNEPNLSGFWSGTREDYWTLYDASARALKRVDARLRVGGPASSKGSWIAEIIDHAVSKSVPIDFVSTHLYPQDEYVDYTDRQGSPYPEGAYFAAEVRRIQALVRASARPDLEIHWTEWNTMSAKCTKDVSWTGNPCVDNHFAASFIARNVIALDDACDTFCYWVASDIFEEGGLHLAPFDAVYGLVNNRGIPKASCNAFRLLRRLEGGRLAVAGAGTAPDGAGLVATSEPPRVSALLWNHQRLEKSTQPAWADTLSMPAAGDGVWRVIRRRILPGAGSAYETWLAMGRPAVLSRGEEDVLRANAEPLADAQLVRVEGGRLVIPFRLQPNEVQFLEALPAGVEGDVPVASAEDLSRWEASMGERSR